MVSNRVSSRDGQAASARRRSRRRSVIYRQPNSRIFSVPTDAPVRQRLALQSIHLVHHSIQQRLDPGDPHTQRGQHARLPDDRCARVRLSILHLHVLAASPHRRTASTCVRYTQLGHPPGHTVLARCLSVALLLPLCAFCAAQRDPPFFLLVRAVVPRAVFSWRAGLGRRRCDGGRLAGEGRMALMRVLRDRPGVALAIEVALRWRGVVRRRRVFPARVIRRRAGEVPSAQRARARLSRVVAERREACSVKGGNDGRVASARAAFAIGCRGPAGRVGVAGRGVRVRRGCRGDGGR